MFWVGYFFDLHLFHFIWQDSKYDFVGFLGSQKVADEPMKTQTYLDMAHLHF